MSSRVASSRLASTSSSAAEAAAAAAAAPSSTGAAPGVTATATDDKQQQRQKQKQKQQQKKPDNSKPSGAAAELAVTPRSQDFSRWYLDVVREAQLADYGPVRGTMVIRPYGYGIWENIQGWLDGAFKKRGVENAYFPQLIPYSFLQKEADHVEGFAPELALVTRGGGKELEEPLVVRPTSETIVNHMFSQWIQSHRDLPMMVNQWANVHRWEMRTRPFVRTLEFLWQEGHTAHATPEEARETALEFVALYERFALEAAALPVVAGRKSRLESFAGANVTYTIEAMMGDKKALQAGTSHDLGDNFARAFNTRFATKEGGGGGGGGDASSASSSSPSPSASSSSPSSSSPSSSSGGSTLAFVHQTSWGVSTRMVGGVVMAHGDDAGLRLPPALAPTQLIIVPILGKKGTDPAPIFEAARKLCDALCDAGVRARVDSSEGKSPGWKFSHWEMKGVPLRLEVGPRDVAAGCCVLARRDLPRSDERSKSVGVPTEPSDAFVAGVKATLAEIQTSLLEQARAFRDENIRDVSSYEELKLAIDQGLWARGWWSGSDADEERVKEETGATLRCFPFEQPAGAETNGGGGGKCLMSGGVAGEVAIFAKSY